MRPKRDPMPRATEAWWWLGGLLSLGVVGGAVFTAGIALWQVIDIRQLAPALAEPPPPLPLAAAPPASAGSDRPFQAVLFDSERNRGYFEDMAYYPAEVRHWRTLILSVGGSIRPARDAEDLATLQPDELLVLPEAPCISADELAAIGAHLARGGSIAANWALGVRDGECEWRGWSTLLGITGAEDLREIPPREALYLTVPRGLPTSPGVDPGTRIELRPDPSIALRMPGARVYWSDWALNPAPDGEGAGADVAVATVRSPEGGRIAWFGLRADQGATPADSAQLARVLQNGIRWAGGVPHASPSAWPGGAQAALVFVVDVEGEDSFVNALDAAAMFKQQELPVTFFAVSQLVEDDARLAEALIAAGEVGSQTVDHVPLAGMTAQEQRIRLQRSWGDIERWTGVGPTGLRPPEEALDAITLEAWREAGGRYVLASNEARSASPEIHETAQGPVVLLPRVIKDDYTVIVRDVTLRSRRLTDAFLSGLRKVRAIGGLAVIAGHTQIIVRGPRLDAVRTVADSARAEGDWWIAQADEVAEWWLARSQVELRWVASEGVAPLGARAPGSMDLLVTMPSGTEVGDLWIDVVDPTLPDGVVPAVDGQSVDYLEESWGVRVQVGSLAGGEVRRIAFVVVETRP